MKNHWIVLTFALGLCILVSLAFLINTGRFIIPTPLPTMAGTPTTTVSTTPLTEVFASPSTNSPTADPLPSPTPYITVFDGLFYCREEHYTSSAALVVLQGQQVTIKAQEEGWLYVIVKPSDVSCWVSMDPIPNLNQSAIALVPFYGTDVLSTFTLPPGTAPHAGGNNGNGEIPSPANNTDTPRHTNTPPPTKTPHPTSTPTRKPTPTSTPCPTNQSGHVPPGQCK